MVAFLFVVFPILILYLFDCHSFTPHKDPVFQPDGFTETYAEMDKTIKNTISHRYRSLEKLKVYLVENAESFKKES